MGEVLNGHFITDGPIDPDRVLGAAVGALTDALVIGRCKDGRFYIASSLGDLGAISLLLARAHHDIVCLDEEDEADEAD